MKLSIIVLSFNTKTLTLKCLKSITLQYEESLRKGELELILTDNGSSDGTLEAVKKLPNLKIVENKENFGFSKGNNRGASNARGECILFLNSDTEIKDDGFLRMADFMEKNPKVGILGGKLLNTDGSIQKSAGNFYNLANLFFVLLGGERIGLVRKAPNKIEKVDWVSGACMMARTNLFNKLRFDENLFMYMEDMELCYRAKKAGFNTYFYPDLNLVHKELGSGSREFAINQIYKGLLYFYKKHKPYWQYALVKFLLFSKAFIAFIIGILSNNPDLRKTYGQALRFAI
jgi:GT2 family glycosyltransferase